jgi:hypothetical protein
VPKPSDQNPDRRLDWPAILRILGVQVLVLLALMIAFVRYVNWSSDREWAEFSRTFMPPAADASSKPPAPSPMRAVKDRGPCARKV